MWLVYQQEAIAKEDNKTLNLYLNNINPFEECRHIVLSIQYSSNVVKIDTSSEDFCFIKEQQATYFSFCKNSYTVCVYGIPKWLSILMTFSVLVNKFLFLVLLLLKCCVSFLQFLFLDVRSVTTSYYKEVGLGCTLGKRLTISHCFTITLSVVVIYSVSVI